MPVTIIAHTYMNPKQKKSDEQKRRRKRQESFDRHLRQFEERELPDESTVSFYA